MSHILYLFKFRIKCNSCFFNKFKSEEKNIETKFDNLNKDGGDGCHSILTNACGFKSISLN